MGILYTVSLPWCSITLYHIEWVNMILNYSFLCHSHFLFSEDLCLPICEMCNYDTGKGKPHSIYLELDFYKNYVFRDWEKRYWQVASEDVNFFWSIKSDKTHQWVKKKQNTYNY